MSYPYNGEILKVKTSTSTMHRYTKLVQASEFVGGRKNTLGEHQHIPLISIEN